jgi:hypothetical protein
MSDWCDYCTDSVFIEVTALTPQPPLPERERGSKKKIKSLIPLSLDGRGARGEGFRKH